MLQRLSHYGILLLLFCQIGAAYGDIHSIPAKISVQQANTLSRSGDVLLIDIRSEQEWLETGIAPQAVPLSIHQAGGVQRFSEQLLGLLNGDKNKPVALICAGGVRSDRVQHYLQSRGFKHVIDVKEGMLGAWFSKGWIEQGLPIKSYKNQSITVNK